MGRRAARASAFGGAGLDDPEQYSTPRDLAWMAAFALRHDVLRQRLSLPAASIRSLQGRVISFANTHALIGEGSPVLAGKTGTTDAAGQCLLSLVREGEREFIVVLLGSRARYTDMRSVLSTLPSLFL